MSGISRKTAIIAFAMILMVVTPLSICAQTPAPAASATQTPEQAQQTPAGKFIQDLGDRAIGVITDKTLDQGRRADKYRAILHDAFDLRTIGRFVIGRAWDTATPEQQRDYMSLFESLVVKIYGDNLNFYAGEKFRVKGVRRENDNDVVVTSAIDHVGGAQPTMVDWRVRQNGDRFAVIDVIIEGVSQSVTQRQEYASIIQRDGGKIDGLLELMRQRVNGQSPTDSSGPAPHEGKTR